MLRSLAWASLPLLLLATCSVYDESLLEATSGATGGTTATSTSVTTSGAGGATSTSSAGGGGSGQGGEGGTIGCTSPNACPGVDTECATRTCEGGVCGFDFAAAGTALAAQVDGDCQTAECDGQGSEQGTADPTDPPDDGKECTDDACNGSTPVHASKGAGVICIQGGGHVCNDDDDCVQCIVDGDCVSNVCDDMFTCAAAQCGDLQKNGTETAVDCGGSCPPCLTGQACLIGADCVGAVCTGGICAASCTDGMKNNGESDVDCGGASCAPCGIGKTCVAAGDCTTNSCAAGVCACSGTHLLISEIRSRGLAGGNDEFVELYNPTGAAIPLDATWTIEARSDSVASYAVRWTGIGESIPSHGHYLIGKSAGGYAQLPAADDTYATGNTDAASIVLKQSGAVVDAVCYAFSAGTQASLLDPLEAFTCEGTPVSNLPHNNQSVAASNVDVSLERKPGGALGNCSDTGDSAADFQSLAPAAPQSTLSATTP